MKFLSLIILLIAAFAVYKFIFKKKKKTSYEKEINPDFKDAHSRESAKNKTKEVLNEKFNLKGKHDDKINTYAEKVIDKVGSKNLLKAVSLFSKFKK